MSSFEERAKNVSVQTEFEVSSVDKEIDNTVRMKSKGTQTHAKLSENEARQIKSVLKVKITKKKTKEVATNTEESPIVPKHAYTMKETSSDEIDEVDNDASFKIEEAMSDSVDTDEEEEPIKEMPPSDFCIVSWSSLLYLLRICMVCGEKAFITNVRTRGSMLIVNLLCAKNHESKWCSQQSLNGMAKGNVLLSAAVLFSGNTFSRIQEMMSIANVNFIGKTLYYQLQKNILFPAVHKVYSTYQYFVLSDISGGVNLIGDGRSDSPGYNAKYGTYSMLDSSTNKILNFSVVHVSTVGNSSRMEKEGLLNCLNELEDFGVNVDSLTTDRHKQVRAYFRKERPDILHQFDIWHVSKNIKKKLVEKARKKACRDLNDWIRSIINHFWWCCATCNKDEVLLKEKWLSILCHIKNKHSWEHANLFKKCEHARLTKKEQKRKRWLSEGSPSYLAVESVVTNRYLLADLKYFVQFNHTGSLEVYHALYNKYCPKRLHFSLPGMIARSELAVLDHNSGAGNVQAQTAENELRYKQSFSKITKNWVVKKIAAPKDKQYLKDLIKEVLHLQDSGENVDGPYIPENIPRNIAPVAKPNKKEAIASLRTRFTT